MASLYSKYILSSFYLIFSLCLLTQLQAATHQQTSEKSLATFLVLNEQAQTRDARAWSHLFKEMRKDGISEVIIQWLQYDEDPDDYVIHLRKILRAVKMHNMGIVIGLTASKNWWSEKRHNEKYLNDEAHNSIRVAEQVQRLISGHSSFKGWYISYEMEALPVKPAEKARIIRFYKKVGSHLKRLTPQKVIAVSGYKQAVVPNGFDAVKWWQDVLTDSGITRLYFQDGFGVHRESALATSNQLLHKLARARSSSKFELWVVVEAFEEVGDLASDEQTFKAVPTSISRLCEQIKQARSLDLPISFYTYSEYMFQSDSERTRRLRDEWRNSGGCNGSITPQNLD